IERLQKDKAVAVKQELKAKVVEINGVHFLGETVALEAGSIKDILFQLKGEFTTFVGVLGGNTGDKCSISVILTDDVIANKGLSAGNLIKETASLIQGGGGGQPFFATAGGKNANGLPQAIELIK